MTTKTQCPTCTRPITRSGPITVRMFSAPARCRMCWEITDRMVDAGLAMPFQSAGNKHGAPAQILEAGKYLFGEHGAAEDSYDRQDMMALEETMDAFRKSALYGPPQRPSQDVTYG